jgi:hypothetical protein
VRCSYSWDDSGNCENLLISLRQASSAVCFCASGLAVWVIGMAAVLVIGHLALSFVGEGMVYYWIEHNVIHARRLNGGMPYWITLNAEDEKKLRDCVHNSSRIRTVS